MTRSNLFSDRYSFRAKLRALSDFFFPVIFLAFGIAWVDWYQGQGGGGNPLYYVGWLFVFIAVVLFFLGMERAHFHPLSLFIVSLLVELYGWWNVFWAGLSLTVAPNGQYFVNGVALLTLGPLGGVVMVSENVFFATSVIAIVVPFLVAMISPRDATISRC